MLIEDIIEEGYPLGSDDHDQPEALKGRLCRTIGVDNPPFQGDCLRRFQFPGRYPGLYQFAPLALYSLTSTVSQRTKVEFASAITCNVAVLYST